MSTATRFAAAYRARALLYCDAQLSAQTKDVMRSFSPALRLGSDCTSRVTSSWTRRSAHIPAYGKSRPDSSRFLPSRMSPSRPLKEFAISSAGFWVQHAGSEILLIAAAGPAGRACAGCEGAARVQRADVGDVCGRGVRASRPGRAGHARDGGVGGYRGTVDRASRSWRPPCSMRARYYRPRSRWLRWASRAAKVGGALDDS